MLIKNNSLPIAPADARSVQVGTSDVQNSESLKGRGVIADGKITDSEYFKAQQSSAISVEKKGDISLEAALRRQAIESQDKK